MISRREVLMTLAADLFSRLRARAASLEVSLAWIVEGIICDTIESLSDFRKVGAYSDSHPLKRCSPRLSDRARPRNT